MHRSKQPTARMAGQQPERPNNRCPYNGQTSVETETVLRNPKTETEDNEDKHKEVAENKTKQRRRKREERKDNKWEERRRERRREKRNCRQEDQEERRSEKRKCRQEDEEQREEA